MFEQKPLLFKQHLIKDQKGSNYSSLFYRWLYIFYLIDPIRQNKIQQTNNSEMVMLPYLNNQWKTKIFLANQALL